MRARAVVPLFLLLPLVTLACKGDDKPPIVWKGEHLRFGTNEDPARLCGGTLPYLDRYAGHLRGRLGGPAEPVNFYWIPDDQARAPYCSVVACTNARSVFSAVAPDEHELVHAIHYRDHVAARPLEEGFAELYGDDADIRPRVAGDIDALLRTDPGTAVSALHYPLAGHFVSFLAVEFGEERLERFAVASNLRDPYDQTAATFTEVFGQSLESAIETYESSYPVCQHLAYRDNGFDCAGEATPVSTSGTSLTVTLDCSDAQVIGPRYGERWTKRVIEVSQAGVHRLTATKTGGTTGGRVRVTRCGAGCADAPNVTTVSVPAGSERTVSACLPAGRHVVRFAVAENDTGDMSLTVEPTGDPC